MGQFTHKYITRFIFKKPFICKSLISEDKLKFMEFMLQKVVYGKVEGDVIECGVYRGGSLFRFAKKLKDIHSDKVLFGLDTFEGHPYSSKAEGTLHKKGFYKDTSKDKINIYMRKRGLGNFQLLKGKFKDMLPLLSKKKFCFAHLDCSLYESYRECIKFLLPRLSKGGVMMFDDYNSHIETGTNKAIDEVFLNKGLVVCPLKQAYFTNKFNTKN